MLADNLLGCRTYEGRLASQHLIKHTSERVDIAPSIEPALTGTLLRTEIRWCTYGNARLSKPCLSRFLDGSGHSKVSDNCMLGFEQNVFRLYVTVNNVMLVSEVESVSYFTRDLERFIYRKLFLAVQAISE